MQSKATSDMPRDWIMPSDIPYAQERKHLHSCPFPNGLLKVLDYSICSAFELFGSH